MPLPLTKHVLRTCYDFLATTEPFVKWNLPDGEDVVFRTGRDQSCQGWHEMREGKHIIYISAARIGRTHALVEVMAHEMIHLYEREANFDRPNVEHSAAFRKLAARVCKVHGFDPQLF